MTLQFYHGLDHESKIADDPDDLDGRTGGGDSEKEEDEVAAGEEEVRRRQERIEREQWLQGQ